MYTVKDYLLCGPSCKKVVGIWWIRETMGRRGSGPHSSTRLRFERKKNTTITIINLFVVSPLFWLPTQPKERSISTARQLAGPANTQVVKLFKTSFMRFLCVHDQPLREPARSLTPHPYIHSTKLSACQHTTMTGYNDHDVGCNSNGLPMMKYEQFSLLYIARNCFTHFSRILHLSQLSKQLSHILW